MISQSTVINGYRAKGKRYSKVRGHTGIDLNYKTGNELIAPVTGEVLATPVQKEMGNCLYVRDTQGAIHVFAHLESVRVQKYDKVKRGDVIAITGNTGTGTSGEHLHYEIMTVKPYHLVPDAIMYRKELLFKGYNTEPVTYLKDLYKKYHIDWLTGKSLNPEVPPYSF